MKDGVPCARPAAQVLEVWYAGALLAAVPAPSGSLRSDDFVPVEVAYDAAGGGLRGRHAGHAYVSALAVHGWAPRRGWRFGLGARTGMGSDDHHVDELLIEAGSAYRAEPVGVELTLNGLQFSEGGLLYEYEAEPVAAEVEAAPLPATE